MSLTPDLQPATGCAARRSEPRGACSSRGARRTAELTLIVLTCALTGLAPGPTAAEGPATLRQLALSALATHEDVERSESEVRRAEADVRLAKSVLLPRLDLSGSHVWYGEAQTFDLGEGQQFEVRPRRDWTWSADLKQTIFSGLRDWRARDVALLYRDIARLDRRIAVDNLLVSVAEAYIQTVAAESSVEVRHSAEEQIREQLRVAQRRFEVGETARADVARWEAELAAARQQVVVAEGDARLARNRLARLAGVESLGSLQAPGKVPIPAGDLGSLRDRALAERLEMAVIRNQLDAAGLWIRIRKGQWLPELEASAQYFEQKAAFPSKDWLSFTLSLKVPIYDGGLTAAEVAKAKEDLRLVELLEREVRRGIFDQVDAAEISHRAAVAALEAAVQRRTAAAEAHRQVQAAYRVGEASATDLLATTSDLTDAETSYVIARATEGLNAIALRRAVGQPPLPDIDPNDLLSEDPR